MIKSDKLEECPALSHPASNIGYENEIPVVSIIGMWRWHLSILEPPISGIPTWE